MTFRKAQDCVLQNIYKKPDLPVMGRCILKFEKNIQVNVELMIFRKEAKRRNGYAKEDALPPL